MPSASDVRIIRAFMVLRFLAASKCRKLWMARCDPRCQVIRDARLEGDRRAYMHVGCDDETVCAWAPAAARLPDSILAGIFLHEFGHLAGGDEFGADRWVYRRLGLSIKYTTPLKLETVDLATLTSKLSGLPGVFGF